MNTGSGSLREQLCSGTRASHALLDSRMSCLDLARREGLAVFLRVHHAAFVSLIAAGGGDMSADVLADLIDRSGHDLDTLDQPRPAVLQTLPLDSRAIDYTVLGSRLGNRVLSRFWRKSEDPVVQKADAYFSAPDALALWKEFCKVAAAVPADAPQNGHIVRDANSVFALFDSALTESLAIGTSVDEPA